MLNSQDKSDKITVGKTLFDRRDWENLLSQRVLVIDGAMGTRIQAAGLQEADFRGLTFSSHPDQLQGCNEVLNLTQAEVIKRVHREYLEAGADIIETNTFNGNAHSLQKYGLQDHCREINRAAAELAREAAASFQQPDRPRLVAGSIGPSSISLSLESSGDRPDFAGLTAAYQPQVEGLLAGGVDCLLVETVFDTLNAKAALLAVQRADPRGRIPVLISASVASTGGRLLNGQDIEAFLIAVDHVRPLAVGLNCSWGAAEMTPLLRSLAGRTSAFLIAYPNAGMPDEEGRYLQSPGEMAELLETLLNDGVLNLVGGCCGTGPEHIAALAEVAARARPRRPQSPDGKTRLCGLDPLVIEPGSFINIGERTNVAGSRRFAKLIAAGEYHSAVEVAAEQIENGARLIDVCMDAPLIDASLAMNSFLAALALDQRCAPVPLMIDSSSWDVIIAALQRNSGKAIVNSISLGLGEEEFRSRARRLRELGAAVIVMACDQEGQALTTDRRISVCRRSYEILTREEILAPEDIVFDLNVLALGTGDTSAREQAISFLESLRWVKANLPGVRTSGGISNISFSFRGHETVRSAIHAVFLYHAVAAGLDFGIVNPGQLLPYDEIPPELLEKVEDLVFNRKADAAENLALYAAANPDRKSGGREESKSGPTLADPLSALAEAVIQGHEANLEELIQAALELCPDPLALLENHLMNAMSVVGDRLEKGRMFLPQVIKSARTMKRAAALLTPRDQADQEREGRGRILLATVKGDVHDIGKNILSDILRCQGFSIIDLGVMVPAQLIVAAAQKQQVAAIGLSGLITPSLAEMAAVALEMERAGLKIPLLIGGATTSRRHTALKIAPLYSGPVIQLGDASAAAGLLPRLLDPVSGPELIRKISAEYAALRNEQQAVQVSLLSLEEARRRRPQPGLSVTVPPKPGHLFSGLMPLEEVTGLIDWRLYLAEWRVKASQHSVDAESLLVEARDFLAEIIDRKMIELRWACSILRAAGRDEEILLFDSSSAAEPSAVLHFMRDQQPRPDGSCPCLADFILALDSGKEDYLGLFALSAGGPLTEWSTFFIKEKRDPYRAAMLNLIANRLAEALVLRLQEKIASEFWGYAPDGGRSAVRPAPGFQSWPDHGEKATILKMLQAEQTCRIKLSETMAMIPASSICGAVFAHPGAFYFNPRVGADQLEVYAKRKKTDAKSIRSRLNLA